MDFIVRRDGAVFNCIILSVSESGPFEVLLCFTPWHSI